MLLTPSEIESAALDIVNYWQSSDAPDNDKVKVLEMVRDFYQDKNDHIIDQYLAALAQRAIDKNVPPTGFENER